MTGRIGFGFDIDWAPDWSVALCVDACRQMNVAATFFATHASDLTEELVTDPLVDVGVHPNFLPESSHGGNAAAVMDHCMAFVPTARVMRTHGLYQSTNLFHLICDAYPQIVADCSLYLPYARNLEPVVQYYGRENRQFVRLPTFFSDDVAWRWPSWRYSTELLDEPGLKVFCFHPIHVALNSLDPEPYENLKASLDTPLYRTTRAQVERHSTAGPGSREYLERLLHAVDPESVARLLDIARDDLVRPKTG